MCPKLASAEGAAGSTKSNPFQAPSATVAASAASADRATLLAITTAASRLVAVGLRGRIVLSDDAGKSWKQAQVPVQSDLVAVNFATPEHGWAVGHRGTLLETTDGGTTWLRRFTDQQLDELTVRNFEGRNAPPDSPVARALIQAKRSLQEKSIPSLLDVWFESADVGTIVGTFGAIYRTQDGGKSWVPWMDRVDNPDASHFYAVRGDAKRLYLAGEKGGVWRLDAGAQQWVSVPTGYAGTLFGLVTGEADILAFGMRGSAFLSSDSGAHWQAVQTPRKAGLVAGLRLKAGDVVLADQTGELLRSNDAGRTFSAVAGKSRAQAFSLAQGSDGRLYFAGPGGVGIVPAP